MDKLLATKLKQNGFSLINGTTIKLRPAGFSLINRGTIKESQNGFSLMEVVVAIGIIAVIGVFSSTILTRTYNSTAQSDSISKLKQNGQLALTVVTDTIRMADGVVCTGTWGPLDGRKNYIVIRDNKGNFTRFWFKEPNVVSNVVQANGNGYLIQQNFLSPSQFNNFCAVTTDPDNDPAVSPTYSYAVSDYGDLTGVSISGGNFTRTLGNEGKDTINILFNVNPSRTVYDVNTSLTMQTTVKVR